MQPFLLKIKELFSGRWPAVVLILFLFFQLIYSFLFPAGGFNQNWLSPTTYLPKFAVESSDNFLMGKIYPLISPEYRLNSDVGNYLELAQNFNAQYFKGHVFLDRPLYSFLIFLFSLPIRLFAEPSYGIIFGLAIFLNFILAAASVLIFFSLLKKLFSFKAAFFSSVLLVFSPYVHAFLIQPMAEILMVFVISLTVYLFYDYVKKPSVAKLIIYSLIAGIFMLGKMFFALSFFVLLLAFYSKRYREGIVFLLFHLIPLGFWYLWVTQIWHLAFYLHEAQHYQMGVWLFGVFSQSWQETARIILASLPNFFRSAIYGFLLIPVIFSAVGFSSLPLKSKKIIYFSAIFSMFALFFAMNLYFARHAFLLFPIIYPAAIVGIEKTAVYLKRYRSWYYPVFYATIIGLMIIISNINIYQVFAYDSF